MKKLLLNLIVICISVSGFSQSGGNSFVNLKDFGAKGDGITDDTKSVQAAIDKCSSEGKKLVFPEGTFMTGTIYLRTNTSIELTVKAVWKGIGSQDVYTKKALIYGEDIENVSITGQGMLHGNGEHKAFQSGLADSPDRPFGVWILRSRNILIQGIHMVNSAYWMQNYVNCDHLRLTGLTVFNHANYNNDGMDITDCHDVIVSDCEIDASDDALCPKSSNARGVVDMVVSNCILASHADVFKMGTASRGGFRRITVNNLVIHPSRATHVPHPMKMNAGLSGIDLMSSDGGVMEDITIQNVVIDSVETPITLKLGDRWAGRRRNDTSRVATGTPGVARNIFIGNVLARHAGPIPCLITGYPGHNVENVKLSNIRIEVEGGLAAQDLPVPENSGGYPFNRMFGLKLPSYGFFVRHVRNIRFRDIELVTINADERRAFNFEDVTGVLENVDIINNSGQQRPTVLVDRLESIAVRGSNHGVKVQTGSIPSPASLSRGNRTTTVPANNSGTVKDYDGNQYKTIKIDNQEWMDENLIATHYNDGKPIPLVTDNDAWSSLTTPGYSWYKNNKEANKDKPGALYNWFTINAGNICPTGWHVPADSEWKTLATNLQESERSGGKSDLFGPGVNRDANGAFYVIGNYIYWWSAPKEKSYFFLLRGYGYFSSQIYREHFHKNYGFVVRCIKD